MTTQIQTLSKELYEQKINPNIALFKLRKAINETVANNKCSWCTTYPMSKFRDELSVKEYQISALCQECQDQTFQEEEDHG